LQKGSSQRGADKTREDLQTLEEQFSMQLITYEDHRSYAMTKKELDAVLAAMIRLATTDDLQPSYKVNVQLLEKALLNGGPISGAVLENFLANYEKLFKHAVTIVTLRGKQIERPIQLGRPKGHQWKPFKLEKGEDRHRYYERLRLRKAQYVRNRIEDMIGEMSERHQEKYVSAGMTFFNEMRFGMHALQDKVDMLEKELAQLKSAQMSASSHANQ
jgi:ribosomal protein L17